MSKVQINSLPALRTERMVRTIILSITGLPAIWLRRVRCRRELSALTPKQMSDTGLDLEAVRRESSKPFWKA